jgi:general secretion pathway protein A
VFYASPTHREALARLHFLVQDGRSLGIVSGDSGTGKTLVLRAFADELLQQSDRVATITAAGLEPYGFLWTLAARLGAGPQRTDNDFDLWRRIDDRLYENDAVHARTAVLVDDVHHATDTISLQVVRLLKAHQQHALTVVLSLDSNHLSQLGYDVLRLSELRIDLESWEPEDIRGYLQASAGRAEGSDDPLFDPVALARLHKLSGGNPRLVCRLADLALVAGAGQDLKQIDSLTVDSVQHELTMALPDPALGSVF